MMITDSGLLFLGHRVSVYSKIWRHFSIKMKHKSSVPVMHL